MNLTVGGYASWTARFAFFTMVIIYGVHRSLDALTALYEKTYARPRAKVDVRVTGYDVCCGLVFAGAVDYFLLVADTRS